MAGGETLEKLAERTPPHNLEAERCVLGAIVLDSSGASTVLQILRPEDFYVARHREIYKTICELNDRYSTVDLVLLKDALEQKGILDAVGGMDYVLDVSQALPTAANAEHYARIVRGKSILRRLRDVCMGAIDAVYESSLSASEQLDRAEQKIFEIADRHLEGDFVGIRDVIQQTFELIERQGQTGLTGIPTGFVDLDEKLNGLHPAQLIIVAGRPSMGKTSLVLNIAEHVGIEIGRAVGVFSLETAKEQVVQNLLCAHARVNAHDFRRGVLSDREWHQLTGSADRLRQVPIYIDDTPVLSTVAMKAKARRLKAQGRLDLLIVDYLQLAESSGSAENRQQEIAHISRSLKSLARELHIPVIAVSQLSRAVESREAHRPRLSDLRESGAIEQDADVVLLLYREEYYYPKKEELRGKAEVIVAKQRNGPTGTVNLMFLSNFMKFENLSRYQEVF